VPDSTAVVRRCEEPTPVSVSAETNGFAVDSIAAPTRANGFLEIDPIVYWHYGDLDVVLEQLSRGATVSSTK